MRVLKACLRATSTAALSFAACLLFGCGRTEVSVLTYNVAGLADGVSASHPAVNTPLISPLLNDYDVVLVQEDFNYHAALSAEAEHEFQIPPGSSPATKSGLARFSRFPATRHHAQTWQRCHGKAGSSSDCMAPKGFSVMEHRVSLGRATANIDIYNLHMEAGSSPADREARAAQVEQLLRELDDRASFKAVIVAGDTNIANADDPLLWRLMTGGGLTDACQELDCPEPERVDRVLYRSSRWVTLVPARWWIPDDFTDDQDQPLSDHLPVAVSFAVSAPPPFADTRER